MLSAIYFNNDLFFKTDKIEYIIIKGMLSAKFQAFYLFALQNPPQLSFGIGHVAP